MAAFTFPLFEAATKRLKGLAQVLLETASISLGSPFRQSSE
jgi:hypothetical protein